MFILDEIFCPVLAHISRRNLTKDYNFNFESPKLNIVPTETPTIQTLSQSPVSCLSLIYHIQNSELST